MKPDALDRQLCQALRLWHRRELDGAPLVETLEESAMLLGDPSARAAFALAARRLVGGMSLPAVLASLSGLLSPLERGLLQAGIEGDRLAEALERVVDWRERRAELCRRMRRRVSPAFAVFLLGLFIPLPGLLASGAFPLDSLCSLLPTTLLGLIFSLLRVACRLRARRDALGRWADALLLGFPLLGPYERARLARNLFGLLALQPRHRRLPEALEEAAELLGSATWAIELRHAAVELRAGRPLEDALSTSLLPRELDAPSQAFGSGPSARRWLARLADGLHRHRAERLLGWMPRLVLALALLGAGLQGLGGLG